jgi:hypothetical protein
MEDKRIIAERNATQILTYLFRFGWLTALMLAALIWPRKSQGIAMARRTLRRLVAEKMVIRRELPEGGHCYVLAANGARRLREELGLDAHTGQSLKLGYQRHRAASNWYLILKMLEGLPVWTEHEIQSDSAGDVAYCGKVADGFVQTENGFIWLEVENTWKNRAERSRIVQLVKDNLGRGDASGPAAVDGLCRVAIVATNETALRLMAKSFAEGYLDGTVRDAHLTEVEAVLLPVSAGLVPGEVRRQDMWWDVVRPLVQEPGNDDQGHVHER